MKFGDHIIWNHHEECIQISTNMPNIGSIICEIGLKIEKIEREKKSPWKKQKKWPRANEVFLPFNLPYEKITDVLLFSFSSSAMVVLFH